MRFTDKIYPICLPLPSTNFNYTGQTATVIGWGRTYSSAYSAYVLEANVTIWDEDRCKSYHGAAGRILEENLCARARGRDRVARWLLPDF